MSTTSTSPYHHSIDTIPNTMRAYVLSGHGDIDRLEFHEQWPVPAISHNEVLIKVSACGLNNTDVNTRTAWYNPTVRERTTGAAYACLEGTDATWGGAGLSFPRIQGADVVGRVVAVGASAPAALLGKRVIVDTWMRDWQNPEDMDACGYFGSECDGGFAEFTKIDHRNVHAVNSEYSDTELATFATSYVTAENMLSRAEVRTGDVVLISGASGGVGSALIQLAKRRGAKTIALSTPQKFEAVKAVGADVVIDREHPNYADAMQQQIGEREVSVVADVVGGPRWHDYIDLLARGGRYTCAGAIAGPIVEFDLRRFYLRDLTFVGATVVPAGVFDRLVGYIEAGEIRPLLSKTYPLEELVTAQHEFIQKSHTGNIVVSM